MLGSVMDLQLFSNHVVFRSRKCFVQGWKGLGILIVHDKYDFITARVADIHQVLDHLCPVNRSKEFLDTYMPHAS